MPREDLDHVPGGEGTVLEVADPALQPLLLGQSVDDVGDLHQVVVLHPDSGHLPGICCPHSPVGRVETAVVT